MIVAANFDDEDSHVKLPLVKTNPFARLLFTISSGAK
jgi:hypothetical protein